MGSAIQNESRTTDQNEKPALPDLPRAIALIVLFGIAVVVVRTFHVAGWPAFIFTFLLGSFVAMMAGGLVGVRTVPSVTTFVAFSGLIEGIVHGWLRFGFVGAIGGAVAGLIVGCLIGILPVMITHLILILFGHDIIVPENIKESHDDQKTTT